ASVALKTRLRKLQERARAMRQALPVRRQPVLLVARHFAEGLIEAVGQEHRIVAEALLAARRPDQRAVDLAFERLGVTVRPGDAQRRDEVRLALLGSKSVALAQARFDALHRVAEVLRLAGP